LFNIYQFKQLIKDSTRIAENSSTLLDLVFTTDPAKITDSGVIDCSISDHALVYVVRRAKIPKGQIKTIRHRSFKTYSAEQFISDLHNISWYFIDTSLTVEEPWVSFKETLISLIDKHAPMCIKRVRGNTLPWINNEIRTLIVKRNVHHKKAKNSGLINDWRAYKQIRNLVTSRIRSAKESHYSNLIEENKQDPSKLWKTIKKVISTNTCNNQVKSLVIDGDDIIDPAKISSRFGLFFGSIAAKLRQSLPLISHISPMQLMENLDQNVRFELSSISVEFVYTQLCAVNTKKSSGIPSRLIKDGAPGLVACKQTLRERTSAVKHQNWNSAPLHKLIKNFPLFARPLA
jgi:hypothetical protein